MTRNEYFAICKELDLCKTFSISKGLAVDDHRMAEMFNVHLRTAQRWSAEEIAIPDYVSRLLRLMISKGISPQDVLRANP